MGCNCGSKGGRGSKVEYVATFSDGTSRTYASEHEARAATKSKGGTYYARTKK
jgi:hypothetical protein